MKYNTIQRSQLGLNARSVYKCPEHLAINSQTLQKLLPIKTPNHLTCSCYSPERLFNYTLSTPMSNRRGRHCKKPDALKAGNEEKCVDKDGKRWWFLTVGSGECNSYYKSLAHLTGHGHFSLSKQKLSVTGGPSQKNQQCASAWLWLSRATAIGTFCQFQNYTACKTNYPCHTIKD